MSEPLYDDARSRAARIVENAGEDSAAWEELQRSIDVANVAHMGLSAARFPTSCRQAYEQLVDRPDATVATQVEAAANSVFDEIAPLAPGAVEVLTKLANDIDLALLTKGDQAVQDGRVSDSGLEPYFLNVVVVDHKTPVTFGEIADNFGHQRSDTWAVGNSIRSDILPAQEAGLVPIWIDAHVWEYERHSEDSAPEGVVEVDSLAELLQLFQESTPSTVPPTLADS